MKFAVPLTLMASLTTQASAGFFTGNDMHERCTTMRATVLGYVAGAYDKTQVSTYVIQQFYLDAALASKANEAIEKSFKTNRFRNESYCVPDDVILSQATDVYCQFLQSKPALRHLNAAILLNTALSGAWPCKPQ